MRNRASTPLSKARVRQSWNKFNLYNISRLTPGTWRTKTFFQQKWKSKSALRDYHGEQVREGQWTRMFKRTLRSVVSMDPAYLAINDGSLESAGRGSGLKSNDLRTGQQKKPIPYMQMTFAPLERRLDTAIFRAMFASSARQARQFVVHGAVTVNGQKMRYPGYLLNPGDMFQVNTERVMYATGQPKTNSVEGSESNSKEEHEREDEEDKVSEPEPERLVEEDDIERDPRQVLKDLLQQSKSILSSQREQLGGKRKQDLRGFSAAVKRVLSRSQSSTILTDSLEAQFQEIQNQLRISREAKEKNKMSTPSGNDQTTKSEDAKQEELAQVEETGTQDGVNLISDADYAQLFSALTYMQENPVDDTKPYATPWTPRDYMSAFAFIPRYLEVNHNICAAVYLRHPVARPGMAEVPTPFNTLTSTTAFAWYLRRR